MTAPSAAPFDVERFAAERAARGLRLGAPLAWRDITASTNDDALAAAARDEPHGAVFGAESQERGRGRRGSSWHSPPGAGLWFSVLLRPQLAVDQGAGLPLAVGLSVCDALRERVDALVQVKWPNDVLADGRKIAGVLVESQVRGERFISAIAGVGLNVALTALPNELSETATSLARLGAADLRREPLLADVLIRLERYLELLELSGTAAIAAELRERDALFGRRVRIDGQAGIAAGVDAAGRLLLAEESGATTAFVSGHVLID